MSCYFCKQCGRAFFENPPTCPECRDEFLLQNFEKQCICKYIPMSSGKIEGIEFPPHHLLMCGECKQCFFCCEISKKGDCSRRSGHVVTVPAFSNEHLEDLRKRLLEQPTTEEKVDEIISAIRDSRFYSPAEPGTM